jgi:hypothetical protein
MLSFLEDDFWADWRDVSFYCLKIVVVVIDGVCKAVGLTADAGKVKAQMDGDGRALGTHFRLLQRALL